MLSVLRETNVPLLICENRVRTHLNGGQPSSSCTRRSPGPSAPAYGPTMVPHPGTRVLVARELRELHQRESCRTEHQRKNLHFLANINQAAQVSSSWRPFLPDTAARARSAGGCASCRTNKHVQPLLLPLLVSPCSAHAPADFFKGSGFVPERISYLYFPPDVSFHLPVLE